MKMGPEAEFEAIAKATEAMSLAWDQGDKQLIGGLVNTLKNRPDSPIANAVGASLETILKKHNMIP
jgi:hypothetical protein